MKKTSIFFAAILAALTFVGCDAILEELYPEFKEGGGESGSVVVSIGFEDNLRYFSGSAFQSNSAPVVIAFVPFREESNTYAAIEGSIQRKSFLFNQFTYDSNQGRQVAKANFKVNTNATYKVIAWLDIDHDTNPNIDSMIEPGILVYANNGDFFLDLRYHKTSDPAIYMGGVLSQTSAISWDQFVSDPFAGGGGGGSIPTASISTSMLTVQSGAPVSFTGMESDSDGWINERKWTINQPGMGIQYEYGIQNLYRTFMNATGSVQFVTVTYEVKDNSGNWSNAASVTIQVQPGTSGSLPVAAIGGAPAYAQGSEWIYLYSNGYDPAGSQITSYEWELRVPTLPTQFQYGNYVSFQMPPATSYEIQVTVIHRVRTSSRVSLDVTQVIRIQPSSGGNLPPVAIIGQLPQYNAGGTSVYLDSSNSYDPGGSIMNRMWTISLNGVPYDSFNGMSSWYSLPTNPLPYPVTFNIELTVKDNDNVSSSTTTMIWINAGGGMYDPLPEADFEAAEYIVAVGQAVYFDNKSTDFDSNYFPVGLNQWQWDFDNGETSDVWSPTYSWSTEGTYIVNLIVSDALGVESEKSVEIEVVAPIVISANSVWNDYLYDFPEKKDVKHFQLNFPNATTKTVWLYGLSNDFDLFVYADSSYLNLIDSSEYGYTSSESVDVAGRNSVWVMVKDFDGDGGPFSLIGTTTGFTPPDSSARRSRR